MAHYAYIDENNVVTQVIVGKDESDTSHDWEVYYGAKRCSYNTVGGVHLHGGTPYRYNFPGPGWSFSNAPEWQGQGGAFIPPKPNEGEWALDPTTALWVEVTA